MAHFVFKDAYLSLNSSDVSTHLESLSVTHSQETPDDTTMGATFRRFLPGLQTYELEAVFHNDFTDNDLDEDLFALMGTTFPVAWRPSKTDAISATNPEYQFTGCLGEGSTGGTVGEIDKFTVKIMLSSGTVTRDVTP
jgi:hypothetical protein